MALSWYEGHSRFTLSVIWVNVACQLRVNVTWYFKKKKEAFKNDFRCMLRMMFWLRYNFPLAPGNLSSMWIWSLRWLARPPPEEIRDMMPVISSDLWWLRSELRTLKVDAGPTYQGESKWLPFCRRPFKIHFDDTATLIQVMAWRSKGAN